MMTTNYNYSTLKNKPGSYDYKGHNVYFEIKDNASQRVNLICYLDDDLKLVQQFSKTTFSQDFKNFQKVIHSIIDYTENQIEKSARKILELEKMNNTLGYNDFSNYDFSEEDKSNTSEDFDSILNRDLNGDHGDLKNRIDDLEDKLEEENKEEESKSASEKWFENADLNRFLNF